ncbi:glutamate synthase large subunit [Haladaptatus cibarius]|uniref:glutamate synthase large subunit n=1 Tax=Haladaptatus cibarius TaxID=453847 RepID=UPI000A3EC0F1|nr:glutamate synthase large subunit [Haladaptatus cibarius]
MTTHLADPTDQRSNCGVGVVQNLDADASADHETVSDGLSLLANLEHRGTTGAEPNTGDGAGILVQRPDAFFAPELDRELPKSYAVGQLFLPQNDDARHALEERVETVLESEGLSVFHWRTVPTDNSDLGKTALDSEPAVVQCFVESKGDQSQAGFDRTLYVARRVLEQEIGSPETDDGERFYVCSLDRKTVVYKGLLTGEQLSAYYPDLSDDRFKSSIAMVHARFSTNTLGAWHLAHPYRRTIHNGEINTIQGNVNWMAARETDLESERLGEDIDRIAPVTRGDQSDTASLDNVLELLLQDGRSLPHALRMLLPEAWRSRTDGNRQTWYDFHASLVEPWDGPALVAATDGDRVGAVLDRNGLRPCRYDVTKDDRLIMASEAGALDTPEEKIVERGRLQPGQLFLADPEAGGVVSDEEVFEDLTDQKYGEWVEKEQVQLSETDSTESVSADLGTVADTTAPLRARQAVWGYTDDELTELIEPMARQAKDPVDSMGDDTPLSVLSDFDRPLFSYFKQLFAQVTNPPIDYIREELVTSLETRLGRQRNLLGESPNHARQLVLESPVLTDSELSAVTDTNLETEAVDITFDAEGDLQSAIERVRTEAESAVESGAEIVVLSDREMGENRVPIPSLLATGAVHHHLVREGLRTRTGLVVESGDPRTVHHLATLVGYGAGAVNPYLAYETIADLVAGPEGADESQAIDAYVSALETGLLKTMAKMGISTVESYRGAQIFEAVGLNGEVVDEYFTGTENRTEGIGIEEIEADVLDRHETAFDGNDEDDAKLVRQGEYEHRSNGIRHQWNPKSVGALQRAVRQGDEAEYETFASEINDQSERLQTLRGLLDFDTNGRESIPIEEVEPVSKIVERFSTAAMSLGSLSPEAHENNAIAMNRIGGKSNTGEGGEPPERFDTERECTIKQVASGRFGVTSRYLQSADELQIKMAQGSKPGEGGHLPGGKVNEAIAHVRHATPGVGLISPPPQHDIYSIEDLKQLIYDLKTASDGSDINVKLVSEAGIGTIAAGVAKANADVVHISGHSGGTGASPRTSIKNAGLPWELGLAEANQMLRRTGLRSRIKVTVDGGMKTGRDVAVAALLGAEEFSFGTASLVTSGCVMARQCHKNTCPVGIATQDEDLRARFPGEPDHVINYMTFIAEELREIMAELGVKTVEEMVGRVDLLRQRETTHPKARRLDLSAVLAEPVDGGESDDNRTKTREQDHELDDHLDRTLLTAAQSAIECDESVEIEGTISNPDRAVGAMLSGRVSAVHGESGLPDGTITCRFEGTAGQSFGAFAQSGVDLFLTGAANDYLGKGLSGGRIAVKTPEDAGYDAENVVVGNVALYGATEGEAYVNGVAGERFGVRNSGAKAVVEGVGDHGCEYMTGGVVAVLGDVGENFAAGMTGGVAYVYQGSEIAERVNGDTVSLSTELEPCDEAVLRRLVENHATATDSKVARELLEEWESAKENFMKVMPDAYQQAIEAGQKDVRTTPPSAVPRSGQSSRVEVVSDD